MSNENVSPTAVVVTPGAVECKVGDVFTVAVRVEPSEVSQSVRYKIAEGAEFIDAKSSGTNEEGHKTYEVTATAEGIARITFTSSADNDVVGEILIDVAAEAVEEPAEETEAEPQVETEQPVVEEETPEQPAAEPTEEEQLANAAAQLGESVNRKSDAEVIFEESLTDYIAGMAPNKVQSIETGCAYQQKFWNMLRHLHRMAPRDFPNALTTLLAVVQENRKGVFSERMAFRFMDNVALSSPDRSKFVRLMNLYLTACNPQTRQMAMKQVDLRATLAGLPEPVQAQYLEYFGAE